MLPQEDRLRKKPGPAAAAVCRGKKSQSEEGRQHPTSVAQDCQDGRFTSTSQKVPPSSKVHGQDINSFSTLLCQPLALIPAHGIRLCLLPYPQEEAVCPCQSPQGCRTNKAACLRCRASLLHGHGLPKVRALPHSPVSQGLNGGLVAPATY